MVKIKIKTRMWLLLFSMIFLWGCPNQKHQDSTELICTKAIYQPFSTGIESSRGRVFTINLKSNFADTVKIEKIFLGESIYQFENGRFKSESLVIYPNDSGVFVANVMKLKDEIKIASTTNEEKETPPFEYEGACLIIFKVGKSKKFISIPEFKEGSRLMNP